MNHGLIFNLSYFPLSQRPLGPYRIAHYLREQGMDIEVIEYAMFWSLEELKELAKSRINSNTKFIGTSHMFYSWSEEFDTFLSWIKQNYPNIIVVSGSAAYPGFTSNNVDYYVRGYGETAITAILNGENVKTELRFPDRKVVDAIHNYPAYPMNSLMVKYEDRDFLQPWEYVGIEFSRGCKFKCAFCNYPVLGVKGDYSRDAEDARIQMQDTYDRFGVTNYIVSDDTFNDRTEKVTKFANMTEDLSFKPYFTGFVRADLLASRPMDKIELARMGFNGHYYGIESFHTPSARAIGKGMDSEKLLAGLLDAKKYIEKTNGNIYRATIGLIVGLPYETDITLEWTKQWLINNWQGQNFISWPLEIYNPYSGVENLSSISMDYKKYGYKQIKKSFDKEGVTLTEKYSPLGERFYWDNGIMDYGRAQELAEEMRSLENNYDFRFTPFDMQGMHMANSELSLEELLQRKTDQLNHWDSIDRLSHVRDYINKKLSL